MPFIAIWAQGAPDRLPAWLQWMIVLGDPQYTTTGPLGGLITWAKYLGLICLLGWVSAQFIIALRGSEKPDPRRAGRPNFMLLSLLAIGALTLITAFLSVLDQNRQLPIPPVGPLTLAGQTIGPIPLPALLAGVVAVLGLLLVEIALWSSLSRGSVLGRGLLVLLLHGAIGIGVWSLYSIQMQARLRGGIAGPISPPELQFILLEGVRYGATLAGLVTLLYLTFVFLGEAAQVRWRRLSAIAWHTIIESFRRTRAPWAVLAVFVIILAFTNWFLGRGRTAELARIFVSTLSVITTFLLMIMIVLMAPISIPNDIRQQTIYTVVSKPVRRLELIWGRLIGYMTVITLLLAILGGVSIFYLNRVVGSRVGATRDAARAALSEGRVDEARRLDQQATQLANRMSARLPIFGSLIFYDSRDQLRTRGVDVGFESANRSHIEGATPGKAIWRFDGVPDPTNPRFLLDRRLPVDKLLAPESLEGLENRLISLQTEAVNLDRRLAAPDVRPADVRSLNERRKTIEPEIRAITTDFEQKRTTEQELVARARAAETAGKADEATRLRQQVDALHSPPIPLEMTFNVFRTTKGVLGEAVNASLVVRNANRPEVPESRSLFPVQEYYTRRMTFPSRLLVGSDGRIHVTVQCQTPTQFLGMAEKDLYVLANQGPFWLNYLRGLAGIWLQALVITAIGLFAGTFLSWPVALLLTLAAYLAGQLAFGFLEQFAQGQVQGGGPIESLIRLLGHDNLASDLAPTAGVLAAQTLDRFFTPILSSLIYIVPNLNALDVSDTVASGFAVTNSTLLDHVLLGIGYALPFTIAAYFILKNREVAA